MCLNFLVKCNQCATKSREQRPCSYYNNDDNNRIGVLAVQIPLAPCSLNRITQKLVFPNIALARAAQIRGIKIMERRH